MEEEVAVKVVGVSLDGGRVEGADHGRSVGVPLDLEVGAHLDGEVPLEALLDLVVEVGHGHGEHDVQVAGQLRRPLPLLGGRFAVKAVPAARGVVAVLVAPEIFEIFEL